MKILLATVFSLFAFCAVADQQQESNDNTINNNVPRAFVIPDKSSGKCVPTPALNGADHYPGRNEIVNKNNLALPTGKAVYAKGQILHISGRVLDKNCVPVSDAIVDIWHTNMEGKYVSSTPNERLNPAPHFTGSGRAVTNNLGHFSFTTIFPGVEYSTTDDEPVFDRIKIGKIIRYEKHPRVKAPNINFRITHLNFNVFNTKIFFERDARNRYDALFTSLSPWWQNQVAAQISPAGGAEDGLNVEKDFILDGKNPYRKY